MVKKDWREFDTEGILKGMLYGMTTNELMTDNRFRHCKSVRDYSVEILERIYKLTFPLSNGKLLEEEIWDRGPLAKERKDYCFLCPNN